MTITPGRIVVGLAHTPTSAAALRWAIDQAALRGWDVDRRPPLRVRQVDGDVVPVLAEAAEHAELLVIGTPASDAGVVEALAERARCPMVHVDEDGCAHDVFSMAEAGLG